MKADIAGCYDHLSRRMESERKSRLANKLRQAKYRRGNARRVRKKKLVWCVTSNAS